MKYKSIIWVLAPFLFSLWIVNSAIAADLSGTVKTNSIPLNAMVLANGKYMFTSAANGVFNLKGVPLDGAGKITLYAFCSGRLPYKTVLTGSASNLNINLPSSAGGAAPVVKVTSWTASATKTGWVVISGTITNTSGTPLCAMVLANGQHMFTCSEVGKYSLTVPLNSKGQVTIYGFCNGLMPFKQAYDNDDFLPSGSNLTGNQEFDLNAAREGDPLYGFRSGTPLTNQLPASVDYSAKMPTVKSQGSTSSCTSWATAYYYKTYQESVEEGWDRNQNAYSPMFLYSMQCRNYQQPWSFIASWETMNRNGCAKFTTMPFVDMSGADEKSEYANVAIPAAATTEAKNYRCGERNELNNLSQVKQALTQGPILLGINYYSNTHLSSSWHPSPENNYMTHDPSNGSVGHAILCVGYDDSKFGTGALKFINSWGPTWAIDGFSWIRYTDFSNIVIYAMSMQDLPNANKPDDTNTSPDAPSNVAATDNAGPYVDITWSPVSKAQYYRIFRAKVNDQSSYKEIGSAYQGNFRDNPEPGVVYYYSVVSYNDIGNSPHYASDTDAKGYVDKGSAKGGTLSKPVVNWVSNDNANIRSNFSVSNIAASATAMEVLVAPNSSGPWNSFGWADPGNFYISWGQDSEYIGKRPFVKIVVSSSSGTSEASNPVQVGQTIVGILDVAAITSLQASVQGSDIRISWTTNGGVADHFEIWRWLAAEDEGNEWIFLGITDGKASSYTDTSALPGRSYYYAVAAAYQGAYGEFTITDTPAMVVTTQANLSLYNAMYNVGEIYNPIDFKLTVWNDGGMTINDYTITIYVYDWDDGEFYYPFENLWASDWVAMPLYPGYYQDVYITLDVPSAYADGHYYSWIFEIDYYDEIPELYEDDNYIITLDGWWSYYLVPTSADVFSASAERLAKMASSNSGIASSRPFSKNKMENAKKQLKQSIGANVFITDQKRGETGPIQFKKPSFNVDHDR